MLRHFLITGTYESEDSVIPSRELSKGVGEFLQERDLDPSVIVAMTTAYRISPQAVDLKEVWMKLSDKDKASLPPRLKVALELLLDS